MKTDALFQRVNLALGIISSAYVYKIFVVDCFWWNRGDENKNLKQSEAQSARAESTHQASQGSQLTLEIRSTNTTTKT